MKRSLSTIPQSIERWMKVVPRGRNAAPRSRELWLWFPIPHAMLTSVRQPVPKLRRAGTLNGRTARYLTPSVPSSRRCGFIYTDSLVEWVMMNVTLLGFAAAIPLMLSSCAPRFANLEESSRSASANAVSVAAVNPPPRDHTHQIHHKLMNQQTQLR